MSLCRVPPYIYMYILGACNDAKCINGTRLELVPCTRRHTFCTVVSLWRSFLSLLSTGGACHLACAPWWCTLDDQLFLDWDQHTLLTIYTENNMLVVTQSLLYSWHKSSRFLISLIERFRTKDMHNTFNWSLYPNFQCSMLNCGIKLRGPQNDKGSYPEHFTWKNLILPTFWLDAVVRLIALRIVKHWQDKFYTNWSCQEENHYHFRFIYVDCFNVPYWNGKVKKFK